ncbi:hypothetical protein GE09DRAFT_1215289 [Coniochaeta sp. 2T2.1]|nr:hypothetical protein GE09DRAFT_1215289 [Coniochaeta sp. 2T2.1]
MERTTPTNSDLERGPARTDTFETLVAQPQPLDVPNHVPRPASNSTPSGDVPNPSTAAASLPKQVDWDRAPKFEDLLKVLPPGFPKLSAQQTQANNGGICRRYEMPGELLISYRGYQVSFAERRVYEWYMKHPAAGRRLTAGQKKEPGNKCDVEEIDILIEALEEAYLKHHKVVMAQREKRTLLDVHREEVRGLYNFLANQDMTDDDAFLPAYAPFKDFCTTAIHQVHLPILGLLYSGFGRWLRRKLPFLKFSEDSGGFLLPQTPLVRVLEVCQVFLSSCLLLIPVSALLFGGLSSGGMFGVVVAFVFLFSAVVVLGRGSGIGEAGASGHGYGLVLGVVAGYAAVLVTFLAQLGNGPPRNGGVTREKALGT